MVYLICQIKVKNKIVSLKLKLYRNKSIFIQISKSIKYEILSDEIKEDEQIPSSTELSK